MEAASVLGIALVTIALCAIVALSVWALVSARSRSLSIDELRRELGQVKVTAPPQIPEASDQVHFAQPAPIVIAAHDIARLHGEMMHCRNIASHVREMFNALPTEIRSSAKPAYEGMVQAIGRQYRDFRLARDALLHAHQFPSQPIGSPPLPPAPAPAPPPPMPTAPPPPAVSPQLFRAAPPAD